MFSIKTILGKLCLCIFICLIFGPELTLSQTQMRIRSTNRHYRRGDWITYSTTRFVRHLTIGPNNVYFATTGGITCYNFFSNQWEYPYTMSDGLADNNIFLVAFDVNTGFLWCVTSVGVSYLEPASQYWYNFYFDEIGLSINEKIHSLGFSNDRSIYLVTNQNHWFTSSNTSGNFYTTAPVNDSDQINWFGAKAALESSPPYLNLFGNLMYNQQNKTISDNHLRSFKVTCWARDNWQNLWLGTWGLGAGRANLNTMQLNLLSNGLWNPLVNAIAKDGDGFWLGGVQNQTEPAGITFWDLTKVEPEYIEPFLISEFHDDRITQIAADGGMLWFGTQNGLTRYDINKDSWRTFDQTDHLSDNRITDLMIDSIGVWVATEAGLSFIEKKGAVKRDSLSFQIIDYKNLGTMHIYDIDIGLKTIWAATEFGLYCFDKVKQTGGFYQGSLGPATQCTFSVSCYGDEVWYATDRGVSAFVLDDSKLDEWPAHASRNYQTDGRIYRLLADTLAVWAVTSDGVIKFDRETNRWVTFTREDGLPADKIFCMFLEGDYIWFGTSAGLTRFFWNDPTRID